MKPITSIANKTPPIMVKNGAKSVNTCEVLASMSVPKSVGNAISVVSMIK